MRLSRNGFLHTLLWWRVFHLKVFVVNSERGKSGRVFVHQQRESNTPFAWTLRAHWCNRRVDAHRSPMVLCPAVLIPSLLSFWIPSTTVQWHVSPLLLLLFICSCSPLVQIPGGERSRLSLLSILRLPSDSKYISNPRKHTVKAWLEPRASFHCQCMCIRVN